MKSPASGASSHAPRQVWSIELQITCSLALVKLGFKLLLLTLDLCHPFITAINHMKIQQAQDGKEQTHPSKSSDTINGSEDSGPSTTLVPDLFGLGLASSGEHQAFFLASQTSQDQATSMLRN
jgi:hypothetical protein